MQLFYKELRNNNNSFFIYFNGEYMNMDDITKITHKKYSDNYKKVNYINKSKYLKNLITRFLISLIVFIGTAIYIKIDARNMLYVEDYVFTDNIEFTKINNWYQSKIGKIIPNTKQASEMVFSADEIKKNNYEKYLDGVKIEDIKGNPVSTIYGGIVVFIGEKDGYNNTLILQGNDGIDYWYGNIDNINVNLYDYLEKDTIIGSAKDDFIYLVLQRNGKYLDYDEYIK